MRVAILSESSADEAALRILVDAILGIATIAPATAPLRSRGWPAVRDNLPAVAKFLHYRTNVEGLVVVVDSNHTFHPEDAAKNRLHEIKQIVERCQHELTPVSNRLPLKIAIGVAVPAIEAWWLSPKHPHINEGAWEKGLITKKDPTRSLN